MHDNQKNTPRTLDDKLLILFVTIIHGKDRVVLNIVEEYITIFIVLLVLDAFLKSISMLQLHL